jgi:DNA-binding IclR family transcriptional regulator
MDDFEVLVARVHAEYREMPGLSLTIQQAARLWGLHLSLCKRVLEELVQRGVLYNTPSHGYSASPPIRKRV